MANTDKFYTGIDSEGRYILVNPFIDARGIYRTESLFEEMIKQEVLKSYLPIYSLRESGIGNLPSIYDIWLTSTDEYDAAMKIVGSMYHWNKLTSLKWFLEGSNRFAFRGLRAWREDMRLRDSSIAKKELMTATRDGDIVAAKKLFDVANSKAKAASTKPTPKQIKDLDHKDEYDYSADIVRLGIVK